VIRVAPPGDKSISHRALLLAAVADGPSRLSHLGDGADVRTTARVLKELGAEVELEEATDGLTALVRPGPLTSSTATLDCANSGTTVRLLSGVMVGLGLGGVLDGDTSLRRRPMRRVIYPLQAMGARIEYLDEPERLPLRVLPRATGRLRALRHRPSVPSAQVKSALLLAGVLDDVAIEVHEPARSRDHTERMLTALGVPIQVTPEGAGARIAFEPAAHRQVLAGLELTIPGDPSSSAFMIGAALLLGRPIRIDGVSDNPSRTAFLDVLAEMGAIIERRDMEERVGEPIASWIVTGPERLKPFSVEGERVASVIDELPLLSVLAARADGESTVRGAAELRVKESDRIALLAANLARLGVDVDEHPDGLSIRGGEGPLNGCVSVGGDHRIAMAFGALGVSRGAQITHDDPECVRISYPAFWTELERLTL